MKKALFTILVLVSISSCKVQQKATAYVKEHCGETNIKKRPDGSYKLHAKCTDLYDTKEMSKYITEGIVIFNFKKGEFTADITSTDSIPNLYGVLKTVADGFKK